jgi:hypothetical protein
MKIKAIDRVNEVVRVDMKRVNSKESAEHTKLNRAKTSDNERRWQNE